MQHWALIHLNTGPSLVLLQFMENLQLHGMENGTCTYDVSQADAPCEKRLVSMLQIDACL